MTWAVAQVDTQTGLGSNTQSQGADSLVENEVAISLVVSNVSGTSPTLDVEVEWSHDNGTTWHKGDPADTFTQITAAGNVVKKFGVKAPMFRLNYVLGGTTPSFDVVASAYGVR